MRPPPFILLLAAAWLAAVGFGFQRAWRYEVTPGPTAPTRAGKLTGNPRARLLLFAHPRCPCTEATLAELESLRSSLPGSEDARRLPDTEVLFFHPSDSLPSWAHGRLWDRATAIPGVRVRGDAGGREALSHGVTTSGHVLLFDASGRLQFSGGITGARGVAGPNAGWSSLRERLLTQRSGARVAAAPVFGCSLRTPETARAGELVR